MRASLKTNITYSLVYQVVLIGMPIFTAPYVSRILGAEGIGQISYTQAIVIYFNLLAALGSGTYGQRLIASKRNNPYEMTKVFWEVVILKVILAIISIILFASTVIAFDFQYKILLLVQIVDLCVNIVDIAWLYQGLENFKKTVSRQILIKIIGVISIFVFVKQPSDTYIYVLCYSVPTLIGYIALWPGFKKMIGIVSFKELKPFKHFKGLIALFIPYLAILLFSKIDKLMLGLFLDDVAEVGFYEQGMKFITVAIGFVSSLSIVLLPRIANYYQNNDIVGIKMTIQKAIRFVVGVAMLFFVGLFIVGENLVPWFFGEEFEPSIDIMKILSVLIIFKGINNILGAGYLIATYQQRKYTIVIYLSAILNIGLNWLLIPLYFSKGAAYTSVVAEIFLFALLLIMTKKVVSVFSIVKASWKYIVTATVTLIAVKMLAKMLSPSIINTSILSTAVVSMYLFILLFVLKDDFILENFKSLLNKKMNNNLKNE